MTVPRELSLRRVAGSLQLLQQPLPALQRLRQPALALPAGLRLVDEEREWLPAPGDGRSLAIELQIDDCGAEECGLLLRVGAAEQTRVGYDAVRRTVFVDRSRSGFCPPGDALFGQRHEVGVSAPGADRPLRLRVLVDWCSVEVFAGDGEAVITDQIFPSDEARGLRVFSRGGATRFGPGQAWLLRAAAFS
jgi:levanase